MENGAACWLFGYGSLLFKRNFDVAESSTARVRGWARRFWQGSPDHRGRPGQPGRVVTLVEDPDACCDGVALRLPELNRSRVFTALDRREAAGYRRIELLLLLGDGRTVNGVTYIADTGNPEYLGPAPLEQIAAEIAVRHGPSGSNTQYLLALARALRETGLCDRHVFEIESHVLEIINGKALQ